MNTLIIAEAGVNHNGDYRLAEMLVEQAAAAGADIVKFQTFQPGCSISKHADKAAYQKETTGTAGNQLELLNKLYLPPECFDKLYQKCRMAGVSFMSTAFDEPSIEALKSIPMPYWKIPSGEITNLPFLEKIAALHEDVILSTGMADLEEVEEAVKILQTGGAGQLILLHCTTEYPAPFDSVNLNAMRTMGTHFGLRTGYSDHTLGIEAAVAAVALGAVVIEKHLTLDRTMEGPDHKASLEPDEFRRMVQAIRNIEKALGNGVKTAAAVEKKNREAARKSIVAAGPIQKGELLSEENLAVKRPGTGVSPMRWYQVLGQTARRDYEKDEMIEL